jgi:hypothetical protein
MLATSRTVRDSFNLDSLGPKLYGTKFMPPPRKIHLHSTYFYVARMT